MTAKERKILIGFSVLVTVIVIASLIDSVGGILRPKPPSHPPYTIYVPPPVGPGLGETPGFPKPSAQMLYELRSAAKAAGISEQEAERLRVRAIHEGMYPEDAYGGANAREAQREQSRINSGFYDPARK